MPTGHTAAALNRLSGYDIWSRDPNTRGFVTRRLCPDVVRIILEKNEGWANVVRQYPEADGALVLRLNRAQGIRCTDGHKPGIGR